MSDISTPFTVRDVKGLSRTGGDTFTSVLLIKRLTERPTKTGNPFLAVELGDKTGSFTCNCFSDNPAFEFFKGLKEGAIVRVEAKVDYYQNRLSPKLLRAEEVSGEQLAGSPLMANLVETAPEGADALWAEFQQHIAAIAHPEIRATVQAVFDEIGEQFRNAPAAVAMHHAYRHGLLEHTCHMARACRALLPLYPRSTPTSPWPARWCMTPARSWNTRATWSPPAAGKAFCRAMSFSVTSSSARPA